MHEKQWFRDPWLGFCCLSRLVCSSISFQLVNMMYAMPRQAHITHRLTDARPLSLALCIA